MDAVKILGSLLGGGSMSSGLGGQVIGGLLKGAMSGGRGSSGSLGDMLGSAMGGGGASSSGGGAGGLGDVLGAALGGSSGGGLGGILGTVAMAALAKYASGQGGGGMPDIGALLGGGQPAQEDPTRLDSTELNTQAELLIEAMINAAKADGRIDSSEEQAILERMGDLDPDEMEFLREKVRAPLDAAGFARRVPSELRHQVYGTSLLAVELDERSEAIYLRDLAQALRLDAADCNAIHREMGAPEIFR